MAGRNGLLITILLSYCLLLSCGDGNRDMASNNNNKDSLNITAGVAVNRATNLLDCLSNAKEYSIFIDLLKKAGLDETLNKPGPFTVFAPTNKAFKKLPPGQLERWKKENDGGLLNFLSNHIVAGALEMNDLETITRLTTLSGDHLTVSIKNRELVVNGKLIPAVSFTCANGVVYMIDEPLVQE